MTKVILDKHTRNQLRDLKEPLEFVDEAGHLLGFFTPNVDPKNCSPRSARTRLLPDWPRTEADHSRTSCVIWKRDHEMDRGILARR